jgi:hypothetical protein
MTTKFRQSTILVKPLTQNCADWLNDNDFTEPKHFAGKSFEVDRQFLDELLDGMEEDNLVLNKDFKLNSDDDDD